MNRFEDAAEYIFVYATRGSLENRIDVSIYPNVSKINRPKLETIVYISMVFIENQKNKFNIIEKETDKIIAKNLDFKRLCNYLMNKCNIVVGSEKIILQETGKELFIKELDN